MEQKFKQGDLVKVKGYVGIYEFNKYGGGAYYGDDDEEDKLIHAVVYPVNTINCFLVKLEDVELHESIQYFTTEQVKAALGVSSFRIVDPISEEEKLSQQKSNEIWDKRLSPSKYYPVQLFKMGEFTYVDGKIKVESLKYDIAALQSICSLLGNTYLDVLDSSGGNVHILMHSPKKKLMSLTVGKSWVRYSESTINNLTDKNIVGGSPRPVYENGLIQLLSDRGYDVVLFKHETLKDLDSDSLTCNSIAKCFGSNGGMSTLNYSSGEITHLLVDLWGNTPYLKIFPDGKLELNTSNWTPVKMTDEQVKSVHEAIKASGYTFIKELP